MYRKKKKKAMTLLEVMIVIFIIGIISSVIGYNMKGSLEKAKAFKTVEAIKKIKEIFELELAQGYVSYDEIVGSPEEVLEGSGLVTSGKEMFKDGWGKRFDIKVSSTGVIHLKSQAYDLYQKKHKKIESQEVALHEE